MIPPKVRLSIQAIVNVDMTATEWRLLTHDSGIRSMDLTSAAKLLNTAATLALNSANHMIYEGANNLVAAKCARAIFKEACSHLHEYGASDWETQGAFEDLLKVGLVAMSGQD